MESTEVSPEVVEENLEVSTESAEESADNLQTVLDDEEYISIEDAISLSHISKSLFYQRKSALGIESIRKGQKAYIKGFQFKAICNYSSLSTYSTGELDAGSTRVKATSVTGVNPNKIKSRATAIAKELVIAELLGEQLAASPELLSEEDRAEIDAYRSHFEAAFPKKEFSPEDLTNMVIPRPPAPDPEENKDYLEVY